MNGGGLLDGGGVALGPVTLSDTVLYTWLIMAVLALACRLLTRRLGDDPGMVQAALEGIVEAIEGAVAQVMPDHPERVVPLVGTLWVFLVVANLLGIVPGLHSPTGDLSATAALAFVVFVSVHVFGVRYQGLRGYLRHYLSPSPILLPFNVIGEITRTVALAVRLFGNIMSLELTALLVLVVAGFLAPVPILMLHVIEALVQAYIFGMLALVYIAGGIASQRLTQQGE
ncbi:ATP synthase subunit a [wastewater metagenome]|uniref:ATP synthase subunit a n=3 Tax=root TaxID=1 RepID=A0A5B8RJK9_9ZZZZ|nr:F0F1 ATP synthase subunit A [Arhodomonas aquaeolei]QEA07892.1 ATP synthase subunit a [uncultured organism]